MELYIIYSLWDGDKKALENMDDKALEEYKDFCVRNLSTYFSAIRKRYNTEWYNTESKLLSVISINGFIIAYNKFIDKYGIKDFNYYDNHLINLNIDFSQNGFPYTSSQYGKLSEKILAEGLVDIEVEKEVAATQEG